MIDVLRMVMYATAIALLGNIWYYSYEKRVTPEISSPVWADEVCFYQERKWGWVKQSQCEAL